MLNAAPTLSPAVQSAPVAAIPAAQNTAANRPAPATSAAGTAPAEMTQTARQIPPVTGSPGANGSASNRPGADGRADNAAEAAARQRDAEDERRLELREMLARLPVPIEAIPKLGGDVAQLRQIETSAGGSDADAPPTEASAEREI